MRDSTDTKLISIAAIAICCLVIHAYLNHHTSTSQASPATSRPQCHQASYYVSLACQDALEAGIPPDLFVRQINQESGFNPGSVSPAGAIGIAQFMPETAAGLGIDPRDPVQALRGAAQLMAGYARHYGDYAKALAAYNGGSGQLAWAMQNCGANWLSCEPGETRAYVHIIMGS